MKSNVQTRALKHPSALLELTYRNPFLTNQDKNHLYLAFRETIVKALWVGSSGPHVDPGLSLSTSGLKYWLWHTEDCCNCELRFDLGFLWGLQFIIVNRGGHKQSSPALIRAGSWWIEQPGLCSGCRQGGCQSELHGSDRQPQLNLVDGAARRTLLLRVLGSRKSASPFGGHLRG